MSLYLSLGQPIDRLPSTISPRSTCFGIRLLEILMTCPKNLHLLLLSAEKRDGILQNLFVDYFVVPFNVHYFVNTAQREAILPFLFF
jgi:hypothetical protein